MMRLLLFFSLAISSGCQHRHSEIYETDLTGFCIYRTGGMVIFTGDTGFNAFIENNGSTAWIEGLEDQRNLNSLIGGELVWLDKSNGNELRIADYFFYKYLQRQSPDELKSYFYYPRPYGQPSPNITKRDRRIKEIINEITEDH